MAYSTDPRNVHSATISAERTITHFGEGGILRTALDTTFQVFDLTAHTKRFIQITCDQPIWFVDSPVAVFTPKITNSSGDTPEEFVCKPIWTYSEVPYWVSPERPYIAVAAQSGTCLFHLCLADNNPR